MLVGCGDDPEIVSATATRPNAVVHATSDTTNGDTSDATDTNDTTDANDTIDIDTNVGPDTRDTTDTTPPVDTTDTTDTLDTSPDTGPDTTLSSPSFEVPPTLSIPWIGAGRGASTLTLRLDNDGAAGTFAASLSGDPRLHLAPFDASVDVDGQATLVLTFDGAASPTIAEGLLRVSDATTTHEAVVFAVAGDTTLPAATWSDLTTGTTRYGKTTTVRLKTAPFPAPGANWTDDSVNVFVPDGFIDRGPIPFVVHFHGHGTTLAATLPAHKYREQVWASGANAILVTPQGPVNAASGNFGKLMTRGGLEALLHDVASVLYRDGLVATPTTGDLVLTEHSGGYQAVALNLDAQTDQGQVLAAHLFDGLYGYSSAYESFARAGGFLRSDYTTGGGTRTNNLALLSTLGALATDTPTAEDLRDARAVIWFTPAGHSDSTWWEQAFAEALRWGSTNARRGPRIELRTATVNLGSATITWRAPHDDWTTGFAIEASANGLEWATVATAPADAERATFTLIGPRRVRVVPIVSDLEPELALPSDSYWLESRAVLVVDGFDRIFGGSWTDLRHDSAARVGQAAKGSAASNEAVLEGDLRLADYPVVIWLVGDESLADHTFTAAEQALLKSYLDGGGHLIISGSEVAYDLGKNGNGTSWLASLGAVYQADSANQSTAKGAGPLSALGSFGFGGQGAPYLEDFPDVVTTSTGATTVLQYANGMAAAVGKAGKSVVVGFPLEVIDDPARLTDVVAALIGFVAP